MFPEVGEGGREGPREEGKEGRRKEERMNE